MLTVDDLLTHSASDIHDEILIALPSGLRFQHSPDPESGFWTVQFWRLDEESGTKDVLWYDSGADERIMMLNAYGWLWSQRRPRTSEASPWQPRRAELTPDRLRRKAQEFTGEVQTGSSHEPDPEDLDPEEIQAVYERYRKA